MPLLTGEHDLVAGELNYNTNELDAIDVELDAI